MGSVPILWVEFEGGRLGFGQLEAEEPFEQRLNEQGDKENKHVRFDALNFLEQQRGGQVNAFELREAFLQSRLKLPSLEDSFGLNGGIGREQRKDPIGAGLPPQGLSLAGTVQAVGELVAIANLLAGPPPRSLADTGQMGVQPHRQQALQLMLFEDLVDGAQNVGFPFEVVGIEVSHVL